MGEKKRKPGYNKSGLEPGKMHEPSSDDELSTQDQTTSLSNKESEVTNTFVLFTESQKKELLRNGLPENAGKNHIPVAHIEIKKLGYSILATEISTSDQDVGFGLCDYNTEIKFCTFSIEKLQENLKDEDPIFSTNLDFLGKYPVAVYAKVAKEVGAIVTDYKDRLLKPWFDNFSTDIWANESAQINDLKPLF